MTQCPKCQSALKDDYGMVTCPSCGSILFIDMDGIAHMGQEEESPKHDEAATDDMVAAEAVAESPFSFDQPVFETPASDEAIHEPVHESMDFAIPGADFSTPAAEEPAPIQEIANEEASYEPPPAPVAEADFSMDSFLGFGDPPPVDGEVASDETPLSPDDPLGLNDFANSEISQAKDGFLMFRVHIAGIDSKEIRDSIREAIVDQRFAWDAAQIMSTISKGVLKIDRLSPIKATILVSRIKRLPVQIRWEQYAITQAEADSAAGSDEGPDNGYDANSSESY